MNALKKSLLISSSLLCLTHGVWAMEGLAMGDEIKQIPKKVSLRSQQEDKHSKKQTQILKKEKLQGNPIKGREDLYYRDDDISEYIESFLRQNETFTYLGNCKYLLTSIKEDFCPIKDQVDGKDYIVAVTDAVDTQNASVNIEYFLDKDSRKGHMKGEDEQEKVLEELINFKPISKENSYRELLQKIENIKKVKFEKNENRLESIDEILNKSGKSIESVQEAFQKKLLTLRKTKNDVFDEILPHLLISQESYTKILFPYNINNFHWLTGEIWLHRTKNEYEIEVYAHDPYGDGKMWEENFERLKAVITKRIKDSHPEAQFISIQNLQSPYTRRQAEEDGVSCGVIAAEGLIKRIVGPLESFGYPVGALDLRNYHMEIIRKVNPEAPFIARNASKFDFLRSKLLLREEVQENSYKKEEYLPPSPFLDLINCPMILDEGLKNLQSRLIKIGGGENKLTSLKKVLLQWINSPEKGDNQDQLREQLKEFVSLFLSPEELVISSEKGDLGLTLGGFYFSSNEKDLENALTHGAFKALHARIERCESFAGLLESTFKEGSLALREIKTLYESYKQGFFKFNPKNINELKENYKHHLSPQAELYATLLSPSLIQQNIAYQLVSRTLLNKVDKQNEEGTHPVRSFEGMHFKAYDYDSDLGLCPGKELAMYYLYQLLIGEGVAPSTLICIAELPFVDLEKAGIKKQVNQALLDGKNIGDIILESPQIHHQMEAHKTKTLYPIQVSLTIQGIGLHTFLQNHFFAEWVKKNPEKDPKSYLLEDHEGNNFQLGFQRRFVRFIVPKSIKDKGRKELKEQEWNKFLQTFNSSNWSLDQIDEDSFARMTLMSFLTDPGDSKADNFMLYRKNQEEKNQKWHIISIDTDRVLEINLQKIENGTKKGYHKVHHKSLFYTLPFFMKEKVLSQKIKNEFKAMNVPLVIAKWLLTLRDENKVYAVLQKESALRENIYTNKMQLPITFKKGQVSTLLKRLQDLQDIVRHHDFNLTLDRVFKLMHPVLHAYYEKLNQKYPDDPLARIYEDNTRENNQELTIEVVLAEEGLNQKDEEGRAFKDILQEFNEAEEDPQNSKLEDNQQSVDEALYELAQLVKQSKDQKKSLTLLDLVLEARDIDLFKRTINAQGPQLINPSIARQFFRRVIKKNQDVETPDSELLKAWNLLIEHNPKLHWYMSLENLLLTPEESRAYQKQSQKEVFKIIGASEGEKYLPQEVWEQLINDKNEFKRQNQDGAHAVGSAIKNGYTLYFKFLPKLPGLEEAVGRWTRNLIGFGAPHVELFRLQDFSVLVSQEIKGLTLKETIQKHPERLQQLDQKNFAQVLLTTMLVNPEDGKPDNTIVEQTSRNPSQYRLIGIDNDQALVPAVAKEQKKGWGKALPVVQVKSILYCFDQMDKPINQDTREYFKSLDPYALLSTWLHELDLVHERQVNLFANLSDNNALLIKLFKDHDSYVGVPFKKGDLHEFYDRFLRLQNALHDSEVKTYHDLLMRVEPRLGKRYGALRHNPKCPKDLYEKFKAIDGKYFSKTMGTLTSGKDTLGGKGISEKETTEDIIRKDRHYTPKIALKEFEKRADEVAKMNIFTLLEAQGGNIEAFASEEFRNNFFKNIDFNHAKLDKEGKTYGPIAVNTQQKLLTSLIPYELHELTLNNCQTFSYSYLQQLHIQDLTHVSLTGCAGVTSQVPAYLSGQCPGLVHLNLGNNREIKKADNSGYVFNGDIYFPSLINLNMSKCPQLQSIRVNAPFLIKLKVSHCAQLSLLKILSPSLKSVDLRGDKLFPLSAFEEWLGKKAKLIIDDDTSNGVYKEVYKEVLKLAPTFPNIKKSVHWEKLCDFPCDRQDGSKRDATSLIKLIKVNFPIVSLRASLLPEEIDSFAAALKKNTTLTSLNFINKITSKGIIKIANSLVKNNTLTYLNLSDCVISNTGFVVSLILTVVGGITGNEPKRDVADSHEDVGAAVSAISSLISKNNTLKSLYYQNNRVSNGMGLLIGKALAKNTSLTELNLSGNEIGKRYYDNYDNYTSEILLGPAFFYNHTLKIIDLENNEISYNIRSVQHF